MNKNDIINAARTIDGHIITTPVVRSKTLSGLAGCETFFKLENFQMTGAFKERGALNRMSQLGTSERQRGIATASAGNHAQGVALHAQRMGIGAKIVMPLTTPLIKVTSTENYGAEVVLHGESYDESSKFAHAMALEENRTYIHPFDDDLVIAGQGTIGKEILDAEIGEDLDAIICPIGGGGLIAGIATYVKETRPDIRIIGVQTETCDSMRVSLSAGSLSPSTGGSTLADGIAVKTVCQRTFDIASRYVDEVYTVSEDEIANAVLLFLEIEKIVVEGAGAVTLAALINRDHGLGGKRVLSVLSGGNIDVNVLSKIIQRGLAVDGRITSITITLRDYPGTLADALAIIRRHSANVLSIDHQRTGSITSVDSVEVTLFLETRGLPHIQAIKKSLAEKGLLLHQ